MAGISDPFAGFGPVAKAKFLLLDSSVSLPDRVRSLNLEHVSPLRLKRPEISRRPADPVAEEANRLALMRRWFFARKPDAGFVLTDFPATLLQARVFDEWLDARDEALTAAFAGPGSLEPVVQHYRALGLLQETGDLPAPGQPEDGSSEARATEGRS